MGTVLEITLHGLEPSAAAEALSELFGLAAQLDSLFSIYVADSAISRLNAAAGQGLQPVAEPVAAILRRSIEYSALTHGTFDVTVGPLVELWTEAAERNAPPTAMELDATRARVGASRILLAEGVAGFERGTSVDLGGVAKGFALDRLREVLRRRGVTSGLLNFGQSSTWALGTPPDADGWRLLVRGPHGGFVGLITLRDQALSVSGSQGQWVEIGGRRYGHILDPRTGRPLTRRREAVVLAPNAALGEALSKALLVLDEAEALELVASVPGCNGLLIEADGRLVSTPGWSEASRFEPLAAAGNPDR